MMVLVQNVIHNKLRRVIMKGFIEPKMSLIHLSNEDLITASGDCNTQMCTNYDCYDCPTECESPYHCKVFKCVKY